MRFCQTDGTPLVDDEPAFDPYATIMAKPGDFKDAIPSEDTPAGEPQLDTPAAGTSSSEVVLEPVAEPIAEPDDVLDLPERADPLKTMYVSDAEMQAALGSSANEPAAPPEPEPPSFSAPEVPPPSFGSMSTPPSPFSEPQPPAEEPADQHRSFGDAPTMIQTPSSPSFDEPAPAPAASWEPPVAPPPAEWTPPPAPDAAWQNQEIGSNTPFQTPPSLEGQSKGLAIGSLVCGILSCLCCLSVLTGPAAVIMGFIAKKNIDENPSQYGGRGLAMGGIITGIVGFLIGVALIIMQVFFGVLGQLLR
jgi:hypothetical protein